jgi:hypothetical protein
MIIILDTYYIGYSYVTLKLVILLQVKKAQAKCKEASTALSPNLASKALKKAGGTAAALALKATIIGDAYAEAGYKVLVRMDGKDSDSLRDKNTQNGNGKTNVSQIAYII